PILYTAELQSSRGSHVPHATACHSPHDGAREDDGETRREGHGNTCEGGGAALRAYPRAVPGAPTRHPPLSVATYEAMVNTKRVTPQLIRRMCGADPSAHTGYT